MNVVYLDLSINDRHLSIRFDLPDPFFSYISYYKFALLRCPTCRPIWISQVELDVNGYPCSSVDSSPSVILFIFYKVITLSEFGDYWILLFIWGGLRKSWKP